jgi:hypothetical protein
MKAQAKYAVHLVSHWAHRPNEHVVTFDSVNIFIDWAFDGMNFGFEIFKAQIRNFKRLHHNETL